MLDLCNFTRFTKRPFIVKSSNFARQWSIAMVKRRSELQFFFPRYRSARPTILRIWSFSKKCFFPNLFSMYPEHPWMDFNEFFGQYNLLVYNWLGLQHGVFELSIRSIFGGPEVSWGYERLVTIFSVCDPISTRKLDFLTIWHGMFETYYINLHHSASRVQI